MPSNNFFRFILQKKTLYKYIIIFIIINIFVIITNKIKDFWDIYYLDLGWEAIYFSIKNIFQDNFIFFIIINILISLNILLLLEYLRTQKKYYSQNNKNKSNNIFIKIKETILLFLAIIGSACSSCGLILFGGLINIGIVGISEYGLIYFNYIVILLIVINIYYLYKKINNPYVC